MPTKGFSIGGLRPTERYRFRPTWFGLCVVEELIEYHDGRQQWQRIQFPIKAELVVTRSRVVALVGNAIADGQIILPETKPVTAESEG